MLVDSGFGPYSGNSGALEKYDFTFGRKDLFFNEKIVTLSKTILNCMNRFCVATSKI